MAMIIRFVHGHEQDKGIRIFRTLGDAVPTGNPDTYYVSDRTGEALRNEDIIFEILNPEKYGLIHVTEEMFENLRKAIEEVHQGKSLHITDPKSIDDLINAG